MDDIDTTWVRMRWLITLLTMLSLVLPATGLASDYEESFSRARQLEAEKQYDRAIDELEGLVERYPQDYTLHLQLAWLNFQAGHYEEAERYYSRAHELSDGALAPTLGLGWTLLRQGRYEQARSYFLEVRKMDPDNASAAEGLEILDETPPSGTNPGADVPSPWTYQLFVGGSGRAYTSTRVQSVAAGPVIGIGLGYGNLVVGLDYRALVYETTPSQNLTPDLSQPRRRGGEDDTSHSNSGSGSGSGPGGGGGADIVAQHEIYTTLAYGTDLWGVSGHYGHLATGLEDGLDGDLAGVVLRLSPLGDLTLEGSYSFYRDEDVIRVALAWQIPIWRQLYLRPAGAYQHTPRLDQNFANAAMAAGWRGDAIWLELGAKGGREWRPAYLSIPVVYNLDATLDVGAWANLNIAFSPRWWLAIGYAFELFDTTGDTTPFNAHTFSVGIARRAW